MDKATFDLTGLDVPGRSRQQGGQDLLGKIRADRPQQSSKVLRAKAKLSDLVTDEAAALDSRRQIAVQGCYPCWLNQGITWLWHLRLTRLTRLPMLKGREETAAAFWLYTRSSLRNKCQRALLHNKLLTVAHGNQASSAARVGCLVSYDQEYKGHGGASFLVSFVMVIERWCW